MPGHGHPAIHNIPPFWACLVSSISTSYPLQLCLKASRDVPKVFNSSGGGGGRGGISGPPTLRFNHRAMAFLFHPTPSLPLSLSLSFSLPDHMCECRKKKKIIISLTRGTFLLHLAQSLPFLVKTTQRDREPTHREHIYPGKGPEHCIPMDLLGERTAEHILHVNIQNWMWHILSFFSLSFFFFLLSVSHVSSPSLKSGFHVLTDHVGHGGQDRSKTKAEEGFGFI